MKRGLPPEERLAASGDVSISTAAVFLGRVHPASLRAGLDISVVRDSTLLEAQQQMLEEKVQPPAQRWRRIHPTLAGIGMAAVALELVIGFVADITADGRIRADLMAFYGVGIAVALIASGRFLGGAILRERVSGRSRWSYSR